VAADSWIEGMQRWSVEFAPLSTVPAQYDFATNVISSEGKVFQLEYAGKAVEAGG
jgi:hypothetical protein